MNKNLENLIKERLYKSTLFLGSCAIGICCGGNERGYQHLQNFITTGLFPGLFCPLVDKSCGRDNENIVIKKTYITTRFILSQYVKQAINQINY